MLCGLSAGLSMSDMRPMRVTDVANIVAESSAMRAEAAEDAANGVEQDTVRDATDEDIRWLMSL
jgi:hypothetical protein